MMAAQRDAKGNLRIDVTAQVAEAELLGSSRTSLPAR